jgi:hypothetical protein
MNSTQKLPHGSENSSPEDISPPAWLMNDQSKTSRRKNSKRLPSVTSLQESPAGPVLFGFQDGRMTSPSGPDHAHVNLSARQAKARGLLTSATCGPHSENSLQLVVPRVFLENRLHLEMVVIGWSVLGLT